MIDWNTQYDEQDNYLLFWLFYEISRFFDFVLGLKGYDMHQAKKLYLYGQYVPLVNKMLVDKYIPSTNLRKYA